MTLRAKAREIAEAKEIEEQEDQKERLEGTIKRNKENFVKSLQNLGIPREGVLDNDIRLIEEDGEQWLTYSHDDLLFRTLFERRYGVGNELEVESSWGWRRVPCYGFRERNQIDATLIALHKALTDEPPTSKNVAAQETPSYYQEREERLDKIREEGVIEAVIYLAEIMDDIRMHGIGNG